jgi:hypothetical protein
MSYDDPYGEMGDPRAVPTGSSRRQGGGGRGYQRRQSSGTGGGVGNMGGYVEVKDRIKRFYELYPTGRIQSEIVPGMSTIQEVIVEEIEKTRDGVTKVSLKPYGVGYVVVKAYAYRTPDDPLPATGHSGMFFPGATDYTRNSELENAETSAWGRALANLDIMNENSIASRDEVAKGSGDDADAELAAHEAFLAAQAAKAQTSPSVADIPAVVPGQTELDLVAAAEEAFGDMVEAPEPTDTTPAPSGPPESREIPPGQQDGADPDTGEIAAGLMTFEAFKANAVQHFVTGSIIKKHFNKMFPQADKVSDLTDEDRWYLWQVILEAVTSKA